MDAATDKQTEKIVLMFASQVGKALSLDTPLPTPAGWTTMGDVKVGDYLFSALGVPCRVVAKTSVMLNHKCYRVVFSDGSEILADAGHKWYVETDYLHLGYSRTGKNNTFKAIKQGVIDTETMRKMHTSVKEKTKVRNNFSIPLTKPLQLPDVDLPVEPYTFGVWLGDGNSYSNQFCGHVDDFEIVENVKADGYALKVRVKDNKYIAIIDPKDKHTGFCSRGHKLSEVGLNKAGYCAECSRLYSKNFQRKKRGLEPYPLPPIVYKPGIYSTFKEMGVIGIKHIPNIYLRASERQRWELLQGLMDTEGCAGARGRCEITFKSEALANGIYELLVSLGLKPSFSTKKASIKERGYSCLVYRLSFAAYSDQPVFKLKRKQNRLKDRSLGRIGEATRRRVVDIRPEESVPVQCIEVDSPDHLFLAGRGMIPTHNSELLLNVLGYYADQEPSPQLMLQPTVEMAQAFSKERIAPMFRDSPGLAGKLIEGKEGRGTEKKSSTTILMKHYPGGFLALVGANSPAGLASRPIRILLADEVDRYPESAGKEGDPLKLAVQRTQNFGNRKLLMVSTPTVVGYSKIHNEFLAGDQREFVVQCPECNQYNELKWENVRWESDDKGNVIESSVGLFCPHCGAKIRGPRKINPDILQSGRWEVRNPQGRFRSYHINALNSPWVNLVDLVKDWVEINHRKDKAGLMEFINLKLGEPWEQFEADADKWEYLLRRREYYPETGVLPDGVLLLTAGVDVQHDRLECTIYGWGRARECWGIHHYVIPGSPDTPGPWQQLDGILTMQHSLSFGTRITVACTFVDSGDGTYSKEVYEYTKARERFRVFSIKGRGGAGVPYIGVPSRQNIVGATLFSLGVDSGKTAVMHALDIAEEGPGFVHYPMQAESGFGENFFKQLTAEVFEKKYEKGKEKIGWVKIRERNEALDCAVYARAAMELLTPNFEQIEDALRGVPQATQQPRRRRGVVGKGITL